jgi:hypothetical protein
MCFAVSDGDSRRLISLRRCLQSVGQSPQKEPASSIPGGLEEFRWDRAVAAGAFSFGFLVSAVMSPVRHLCSSRLMGTSIGDCGVASTARHL